MIGLFHFGVLLIHRIAPHTPVSGGFDGAMHQQQTPPPLAAAAPATPQGLEGRIKIQQVCAVPAYCRGDAVTIASPSQHPAHRRYDVCRAPLAFCRCTDHKKTRLFWREIEGCVCVFSLARNYSRSMFKMVAMNRWGIMHTHTHTHVQCQWGHGWVNV